MGDALSEKQADPRITGNVVALRRVDGPLTPDECRRVRAMLEQVDKVFHACPMARRILDPE
jgi:hypothetical protein